MSSSISNFKAPGLKMNKNEIDGQGCMSRLKRIILMVWMNITSPNLQSLYGSMPKLKKPQLMSREVAQDTSCILQIFNAFIDE